jgi:hypothetical protein
MNNIKRNPVAYVFRQDNTKTRSRRSATKITWMVLLRETKKEMSKTQDESMLNDHTVAFGPYQRFLFSCPQQEGSWLCHPSSCQGSDSFSSPEIYFSFSCLDPYRNPCHGRLFLGAGEDCETCHGHGSTCGEGTNAYRNARLTTEGSWPTASRLVSMLV